MCKIGFMANQEDSSLRTTFRRATDSLSLILLAAFVSVLATAAIAGAEARPYFVAYDHRLEEPGNLATTHP